MSNDWTLEPMREPASVVVSPLFQQLKDLARRWNDRPTGRYLASGYFESQMDSEDLLSRLNSIRNPDNTQEVLDAAHNFATLGDRSGRMHELLKVLVPYDAQPLPPTFPRR